MFIQGSNQVEDIAFSTDNNKDKFKDVSNSNNNKNLNFTRVSDIEQNLSSKDFADTTSFSE